MALGRWLCADRGAYYKQPCRSPWSSLSIVDSPELDEFPGLDLDNLTRYIATAVPDLDDGPLHAELIKDGRSNITYFLANDSQQFVLQRPPLGHLLATAHDMSREFQVTQALYGSNVPVPKPLHLCQDESVIGTPFWIMDYVDGATIADLDDAMAVGAAHIPQLSYRFISTLGNLHSIDPNGIGLRDFGQPDGYLERQLSRWGQQLDASRSGPTPVIDALGERLATWVPQSQRATIVHGDYRLENVIVDKSDFDQWDIAAVVDWEMSTLGDPLADLGLFALFWSAIGCDPPIPMGGSDAAPPFPSSDDLVSTYGDLTGLDLEPLPWYIALATYKMAIILEGIVSRHDQGQTVGDNFGSLRDWIRPMADSGMRQLDLI